MQRSEEASAVSENKIKAIDKVGEHCWLVGEHCATFAM